MTARGAMRALGVSGFVMLTVQCGGGDSDRGDTHRCYTDGNPDWNNRPPLQLIHDAAYHTCPLRREPSITMGGTVRETYAPSYPNVGNATTLYLKIYDHYYTTTFTGEGLLTLEAANFGRVSPTGPWDAQLFVYFAPQVNPDWGEFSVSCFSGCGAPKAWLMIEYEDEEL